MCVPEAMLIARKTVVQLPITMAIAVKRWSALKRGYLSRTIHCLDQPSVPSERVASFCSSASIWVATAALRSRSSFKFSSSAFFSLTRATNAGGGPVEPALALPAMDGCRMWVESGRVGNDMVAVMFRLQSQT